MTAANVTLANIQFKNAYNNNTGAASYITGNYVKIINCTFMANHADVEAAAIYLVGNDAYLFNCSFINNSAKYTGAMLIRSHNGRICDSYFEGNKAQIDYLLFTRGEFYIIECKNLFGNITVDSSGQFYREYEYNGKRIKEGMYSPYTQAVRHKDMMRKIWASCHSKFENFILG